MDRYRSGELVRHIHRDAAAAGGDPRRGRDAERADRDALGRERRAEPDLRLGRDRLHGLGGERGGGGDGGGGGERRRGDARVSRRGRRGDRQRGHRHAGPRGGAGGRRNPRAGEGDGGERRRDADLPGDGDAARRGRPGRGGRVAADGDGALLGSGERSRRRDGGTRRGLPCRALGHGVQRRHQGQHLQRLRPRRRQRAGDGHGRGGQRGTERDRVRQRGGGADLPGRGLRRRRVPHEVQQVPPGRGGGGPPERGLLAAGQHLLGRGDADLDRRPEVRGRRTRR